MVWLLFAILSVIGLAVYKTAIKFISTGVSPILLMAITSFFYFLFWFLALMIHQKGNFNFSLTTNQWILVAILSLAFFVSDYFLVQAYIAEAKLSTMTVLMGLSMLLTVLFGIMFFREKLNTLQLVGVVLGVISFILLTMFEDTVS
ncbi:MAG: DMT family transporter [Candidatus Peregrinibacteria bacterium]|nr:DMT family transporter [Candidatus Peregrinibacteria bacterium]